MPQSPLVGGKGILKHLCMDIDHDGLCDRCGREVAPIKVDDVAGVETGRCTNCDRPSDDYDTTCQGCGARLVI